MTNLVYVNYRQAAIEHALAVRRMARDLHPDQISLTSERVWRQAVDSVDRATRFLVQEGVACSEAK